MRPMGALAEKGDETMTKIMRIIAFTAGTAAIATSAPALAQYAQPYGAQPYGYGYGQNGQYNQYNQYGQYGQYGYNANATQMAEQQCTAAVQNRLSSRTGLRSILGA